MGAGMVDTFDEFKVGELAFTVEKATAAGVEDAQAVVDALLENVAKWKEIMARDGMDRAAYAQALWDEIYSKL